MVAGRRHRRGRSPPLTPSPGLCLPPAPGLCLPPAPDRACRRPRTEPAGGPGPSLPVARDAGRSHQRTWPGPNRCTGRSQPLACDGSAAAPGDAAMLLTSCRLRHSAGSTHVSTERHPWRVPPTPPSLPAVIDHVAHAVERWELAWPRYVGELGGQWRSGGLGPGFAPSQLGFANGARLEVLAPNDVHVNPFLRRFLDRSGPGPHHLTFKVPDLDAALDAVEQHGLRAVNINRSDPDWQEAFIHPRQASGIVVQLAQASGSWENPPPEGFPTPADPPSSLMRATHVVADMAAACALFAGLLGGTVHRPAGTAVEPGSGAGYQRDGSVAQPGSGADPAHASDLAVVDVTWDAPLAMRLVGPAGPGPVPPAVARWLAGAPGRLHHLACALPTAHAGAQIADATLAVTDGDLPLGVLPGDAAVAVVPPEANLGLRLVLTRPTPPPGVTRRSR